MTTTRTISTLTIRQKMLEKIATNCKNSDRPRALQATKAIRRIKEGIYGYCMSCGMHIPERDTDWKPERTHCSQCESQVRSMKNLTEPINFP